MAKRTKLATVDIIDIGTNDLSRDNVLQASLAARIVEYGKFVAAVDSAVEVLICQLLPRLLTVRPHGRRLKPTSADFNNARLSVNRSIEALTKDLPHIHYWRHGGMNANWEQYFDRFGVHLNAARMRKYFRTMRGVALFAAARC